jgi:hypothetical protein
MGGNRRHGDQISPVYFLKAVKYAKRYEEVLKVFIITIPF